MAKAVKVPPPQIINDVAEIKTVKRKIQFHDLHIDFEKQFKNPKNEDQFLGFFNLISRLAETKDPLRYQPVFEARVFMQDVRFIDAEKKIYGKLLYVRMDVFPELIDVLTDVTEDIETLESQGIVETTHFIIDYSKKVKKIGLEYNHAGAKIADFMTYITLLGIEWNAFQTARYVTIAKDELAKVKDKIGLCSTIDVRVHKDNIDKIEKLDNKLYSVFRALQNQYEAEYLEFKMRFSYKKRKTPQLISSSIKNILDGLVKDKENLKVFETLKIRALDRANNFNMALFDLLIDRVESEVIVQRKPKHKVIVSVDMFEKIKESMIEKKI